MLDAKSRSHSVLTLLARKWLAFAALMVASLLPAMQPLLVGSGWRSDGLLHLYRLAQLERHLRYGDLFPRWLADLGLGFGFPLFNYYAPLSYYPPVILRLLGLPLETALAAGFLLAQLLLALGTYLWTRAAFGSKAALPALVLISYAPYTLFNTYHREAYAELWGLACLAWTLWAIHRLAQRSDKISLALAAGCVAALMLSHNISALIGFPLLCGYALLLTLTQPLRGRAAWAPFLALALGLGLSAFFWLPALGEQGYVQIAQLRIYDYRDHFLSWRELFALPAPAAKGELNPVMPLGIGLLLPFIAWMPFGKLRVRWVNLPNSPHFAIQVVLVVVTFGLLLMTLPLSLPLWEHLPLVDFVQFPWRFLGPASLGFAVLGGLALSQLPIPERFWSPTVLLVAGCLALPWLFPAPGLEQPELTPSALIRIEQQTNWLGATAAGDYLPRWVAQRPAAAQLLPVYEAAADSDYLIPRLDPDSLPAGASVVEQTYRLTRAQLTLDAPIAFRARFRWYYYPGWQVLVDGNPVPVMPDGPHGLLAADIPAGRHTVQVAFRDTPLRRAANVISLATLCLMVVGLRMNGAWRMANERKSEKSRKRKGEKTDSGLRTNDSLQNPKSKIENHLPLFFIGVAIFSLKTFYLDRHDNPFHPWDFDGQQVRGVDVSLQVRFGDDLLLMGYDLAGDVWASDQPATVTLYWRALLPVSDDYSVALHLLDGAGFRYAQEDHQHPGGYTTTMFREGEFIRDRYTLAPFVGTPPGAGYRLLVKVYDSAGHLLDAWDSSGAWLGNSYALTEGRVIRPATFPDPATLPIALPVDVPLGAGMRLLGTGLLPEDVDVGAELPLTLYWLAESVSSADDLMTLQNPKSEIQNRLLLVDALGAIVAQSDAPPGRAAHPTSAWLPGEVLREERALLIPAARFDAPEQALASGRYELRVALVDAAGQPLGPTVTLGMLQVVAPERIFDPTPRLPLAHIGEFAALLETTSPPTTLAPGDAFDLTLLWRAEASAAQSYIVFVHLTDASGRIIAQRDAPPAGGARSTTSWLTNELIRDTYTFTLPPDLPPGDYTLKVGLYDARTYIRLPVAETGADGVIIGQIQVEE